jgi:hypothetical protein
LKIEVEFDRMRDLAVDNGACRTVAAAVSLSFLREHSDVVSLRRIESASVHPDKVTGKYLSHHDDGDLRRYIERATCGYRID